MSILNTIVSFFVRSKIERIEHFMLHPGEVQENAFNELIGHGKNTAFGNQYHYKDIRTIADYQKQVPVSTYEELFPFIERMLKGEDDVLWNQPVKWFSKSSGTTNDRSKYIPLPDVCLEEVHYRGGKDLIAIYLHNHPESTFFLGKGLALGGSLQQGDKGIKSGDVSAVIMQNLPVWAELMRTPDLKTALQPDYETKLRLIIDKTLKRNVTNISGVPTWTYVLIKKILEETGKDNILEVWPQLEWYAHGGVSFEPYRKLFAELMPSDQMNYTEIYNASEGFFAIQDQKDSRDLLLLLDYGIFYEFILPDQVGEPYPKALTIEEVELGVNYAMIITVMGGLWRYMIGDTVKFTSKKPYRIRISGRTKHFINAFGEELMIDNAEDALRVVCNELDCTITDYTAAPKYFGNNEQACHQWLIEFEKAPDNAARFAQRLDEELRSLNSDYDAKRVGNMALKELELIIAPPKTFYAWLQKRNKLGGQHKVPRLSNDRKYLDALLELV